MPRGIVAVALKKPPTNVQLLQLSRGTHLRHFTPLSQKAFNGRIHMYKWRAIMEKSAASC